MQYHKNNDVTILHLNAFKPEIVIINLKHEMKSDDDHATMRESNLVWFFYFRRRRELLTGGAGELVSKVTKINDSF